MMRVRPAVLVVVCAAGVALFQAALVLDWTRRDRVPPGWDPAVHLGTALDYREALAQGSPSGALLTRPRPGHPPYPPLYHYSLIPLLDGEHPHRSAAWLNLGYWLVLVLAAGWLAFQAAGAWPACATLLATGLSPGLSHKFREVFPDLSLAAWVTLAYALLLRSRLYESRRSSVALGVCAGLAMNSKWGAVLYLLPALLPGLKDRARRRNLALAVGTCALLCLPWFTLNGVQMLPRIWTSVTLGHHQGQPLTWTADNWLFYPDFLLRCFGWPALLLFVGGWIWSLRGAWKSGLPRERAVLSLWLAFSYLFCTLIPSKDWRYFLPAAAALPVLGAAALPGPALAGAALAALEHARHFRRPEPGDWRHGGILGEAERRRGAGRPFATLCVLANHRGLNATALSWEARRAGLSGLAFGGRQTEIPEWSDLVLTKTGDPGPFLSDETRAIRERALRGEGLFPRVFEEAGRWPLPDGSEAVLWAQRASLPALTGTRRYAELAVRSARLEGVVLRTLGPGRYRLDAEALRFSKLAAPVRGVSALLEGARLIEDGGRPFVLGLGSVKVLSASVDLPELERALSERSRLPLALVEALVGSVRSGTLAGLRLPMPDLGAERRLSADPPRQPFALDLPPLRFAGRGLVLGAAR